MHSKFTLGITSILLLAILSGCSQGTSDISPVTPGLSVGKQASSDSNSQVLWGFWNVIIDPGSGEVELVPVRHAEFQANVTQFLQPPISPVNLLSFSIDIGSSDIANGIYAADVTIKHPFPGLPVYRGFDVRGICMGNASVEEFSGDGGVYAGVDELRVLNADGHTRWWNPEEFASYNTIFGYTTGKLAPPLFVDGTINAFKYFADSLGIETSMDDLDLDERGSFSPDKGTNSRRYLIQFPMDGDTVLLEFNYAVTAGYEDPDDHSDPEYPVDAYTMSANQAEAFRVKITDDGSTAFYIDETNFGGNINLNLEIFDWGLADAVEVWDEISAITLESATLFPGQVTLNMNDALPGTCEYSVVFPVTIPNVTPQGVDNQEILVRVLSADPTDYSPQIEGLPDIYDYPDAPLCAYNLWEVPISGVIINSAPEVGIISGPVRFYEHGDPKNFELSYATDPEDGDALTILWENDTDDDFGDDLDSDDTNLGSLLDFTEPPGDYEVIARAEDSDGLYTDSDPFAIPVLDCPGSLHDSFSPNYLTGVPGSYFWRMDASFLSSGTNAGQLLLQNDFTRISRFDTSGGGSWAAMPFIDIHNTTTGSLVYSIDVCDFSGRTIVGGRFSPIEADMFQVYDAGGNYLTQISVGAGRWISAIDTDDNGDVYVATCVDNGWGNPDDTYVQRFEYVDGSPYYTIADELDISEQVPQVCNIWDIAVSYLLDQIFVLRGNHGGGPAPYGEMYVIDIAGDGTLTLNSLQDTTVFPTTVTGAYSDYVGYTVYGDIEIDHSDETTDGCRIVVMARSSGGFYLGLLNGDLEKIDMDLITYGGYYNPYAFTIKPAQDPSDRQAICSYYNPGIVIKSEAPSDW